MPAALPKRETAQARRAAKKRERVKRQDMERRLKTLEREVAGLRGKFEELAARMSDPELFKDYAQVKMIGDEMNSLKADIEAKRAELEEGRRVLDA